MRLRHFFIGSIRTQDLLISKSFLPIGAASQDEGVTDIQAVWARFLDLFQNELRWTTTATAQSSHQQQQSSRSPNTSRSPPLHSSSPHSSTSSSSQGGSKKSPAMATGGAVRSGSGMAGVRADSPPSTQSSGITITGDLQPVAIPLFSTDCCFIYQTCHDLIFVACCPLPPTPSTASATVTRIPFSLPGRHSSSYSGGSVPGSPGGSSLLDSQQELQQQRQEPLLKLAYSTAVGLHTSYHGMIEFLGQLITALDHFLVPNQQGSLGSANTGGRSGTATAAANATATKSKTRSASTAGLSVELVQLNTGIVYEILEECMSLGYPMMPSLVQLDLLIFGVPKTTS